MSMNANWPRWIKASVSKHFDDSRGTLPMFIEGQYRHTRKEKDFIELRMDGPQLTEISRDYWRIYGEVNVLITSVMDNTNYHRIDTNVGIVAAAFTTIGLFKYGVASSINDQSQWGCWNLLQDSGKRQRLDIFRFGQVDVSSEVEQASVEGHYELKIRV